MLPINIMSCRYVLVLHGSTYSQRLWCIWELFTLFSFSPLEVAISRLKLLPLDPNNNVLKRLESFDIKDSHCYDPNEEMKLRYIIVANGEDEFNRRIRELASNILNSKN